MTGIVAAVSASPVHRTRKAPQAFIRIVAGLGVDGDAHAGVTVKHRYDAKKDPTRANLRQVHLIQAELHDELQQKGLAVAAGEMGENVTTRGLDLLTLPTGTQLKLGARAIVELTGLREPCVLLNRIQSGLMAATLERDASGNLVRKAGVMSIVVASGDVWPGDTIEVVLPPAPHRALEPV